MKENGNLTQAWIRIKEGQRHEAWGGEMRQESALQAEGKAGCPHLGMWRETSNSPVRVVRQRDGAEDPGFRKRG